MVAACLLKKAAVFIALNICLQAPVRGQNSELDRFVGRDLWKGHPSRSEAATLARIVGVVPKGYLVEPGPWHVWKINHSDQARYVVLLGESLMIIPGGSSACIQLFDRNTNKIREWCFQTGWRINLYDASMKYSGDLSSDLIVLRVAPVVNGRNIAKEYFAIAGDRLRLVRLENDRGVLVQNDYVLPNTEIGVIPEPKTVKKWIGLLESQDKSDVLSALTFLGGHHVDEPERRLLPGPKQSKYADMFEDLLANNQILRAIDHLRSSEDQWIKQAASLAARPPLDRPIN